MFRRRANVANTRLATRFIGILLVPGDPAKGDESMRESEWHPRPRILLCQLKICNFCPRVTRGRSSRNVGLQTIDYKALSRGISGKSAPILAEIEVRKSQESIFVCRIWYKNFR